jgi:hypothetical protein
MMALARLPTCLEFGYTMSAITENLFWINVR